jgi:hypothetical protein
MGVTVCSTVIAEDDATLAQASQYADVAELVRQYEFSASGTYVRR